MLLSYYYTYKNNFSASQKSLDNPFRKIVVLAKLLLGEMSYSTVSKMRGAQTRRNINHFIGGQNLFRTKRTYLLNKGEKTPFRKIVILENLLFCEMSSCTVNKMRSPQTLRHINLFIGGHNLFQTKRTYLLNKGEKTPFRKIAYDIARADDSTYVIPSLSRQFE